MVSAQAKVQATRLQAALRTLLHHDAVVVRPYGAHLVVDVLYPDGSEPTARLTSIGDDAFEAAFRNQSGRWEPLPGEGTLDEMAALMVDMLSLYLTPI